MHKYVLAAMVSLVALSAAASEKPTTPTNPTNTNQNHNGNTNLNGNANLNGNKNYNTNKNYNNSKSSAGAIAGAEAEQGQGQGQEQSANNNQEGDDIEGSWSFTYVEPSIVSPPAAVGPGYVVTTDGYRFGPIWNQSEQTVNVQPSGMLERISLVQKARVNDGTDVGRAYQRSAIITLCGGDRSYRKLAELSFGEDACSNLHELFKNLP